MGCPLAASLQQENPNCGRVATTYHWGMGTPGPASDRTTQSNSGVDVFVLVWCERRSFRSLSP